MNTIRRFADSNQTSSRVRKGPTADLSRYCEMSAYLKVLRLTCKTSAARVWLKFASAIARRARNSRVVQPRPSQGVEERCTVGRMGKGYHTTHNGGRQIGSQSTRPGQRRLSFVQPTGANHCDHLHKWTKGRLA